MSNQIHLPISKTHLKEFECKDNNCLILQIKKLKSETPTKERRIASSTLLKLVSNMT
jgi:hypothetical protein